MLPSIDSCKGKKVSQPGSHPIILERILKIPIHFVLSVVSKSSISHFQPINSPNQYKIDMYIESLVEGNTTKYVFFGLMLSYAGLDELTNYLEI